MAALGLFFFGVCITINLGSVNNMFINNQVNFGFRRIIIFVISYNFYKMHSCCQDLGLLFNLLLKNNYNQTIEVMHYVIIISVNICISYQFIWFNFLIVRYLLSLVSLSNNHKTSVEVCILLDLFTHLRKDPIFYHYI